MDWNNDGFVDLLVGHYGVKKGTPTARIQYYERRPDGMLKDSKPIKCNNREITGRYLAPCVVDWNNDGLFDLIVGSSDDTVNGVGVTAPMLFVNEGTKEQYRFTEKRHLKTSNGRLIADFRAGRVHAKVTDLDNDGRKDVVLSGYGFYDGGEPFFFYRNAGMGSDNLPILETAKNLFKHNGVTKFTSTAKFANARFCFYDWNGDGFEDVIWADNCRYPDRVPTNPIYISLSSDDGPNDIINNQRIKTDGSISVANHHNTITITGKENIRSVSVYSVKGARLYQEKSINERECKIHLKENNQCIIFHIECTSNRAACIKMPLTF